MCVPPRCLSVPPWEPGRQLHFRGLTGPGAAVWKHAFAARLPPASKVSLTLLGGCTTGSLLSVQVDEPVGTQGCRADIKAHLQKIAMESKIPCHNGGTINFLETLHFLTARVACEVRAAPRAFALAAPSRPRLCRNRAEGHAFPAGPARERDAQDAGGAVPAHAVPECLGEGHA